MTLAEHSTWIKLNRNITRWAWYKNGNTVRVFLHLLLRANVRASKFMGITIQRGEAVGGLRSIADDLDISMQQVRTAIGHLQKTGEISVKNYSKFSVFHIEKYEQYQNQNATESAPVSKTKRTNHKQTKVKRTEPEQDKAETSTEYVPQYWEMSIPQHYHGQFKSLDDYYAYANENVEEVEKWVMS